MLTRLLTGESDIGAFWSLSVVLLLAVIVPLLFRRLRRWRIPGVVGEILAGILVGRSGLAWVNPQDPMLTLLSEIGFVFLMFLAGMEIDLAALSLGRGPRLPRDGSETGPSPLRLALEHFGLTLLLAGAWAWLFGRLGWTRSPVLMALVISTTSLGVVMPVLKERGLLGSRYGQTLLVSALVADFATMLLITVQVALLSKGLTPEILLVGLLFVALFVLYRLGVRLLPGLRPVLDELAHATTHIKMRVAFWLFVAFVALAEVLGVEVILGAFLAGLLITLLAGPEDHEVRHQLESIGYGFFVPVFFVMVGAEFNVNALQQGGGWLLPALLLAAAVTKIVPSGVFRRAFSWRQSLAGGILLSARLSLIIAAAEIGQRLGVLDESVVAAVVLVAILSVIAAPVGFARLVGGEGETAVSYLVIVGAGHLGTHLAAQLQAHHEQVVLLDDDAQRVARARQHGLEVYEARPFSEAAAQWIERATALIITHAGPATALAWARWAREHFGLERVLVLSADARSRKDLEAVGATPITPLEAQATFLALMARNPEWVNLLVQAADQRDVWAVTMRNPAWDGRRLREIAWPPEVLVLTIQRDGNYLIPHGNTRLRVGDVVTLLGTPEALETVRGWLQG